MKKQKTYQPKYRVCDVSRWVGNNGIGFPSFYPAGNALFVLEDLELYQEKVPVTFFLWFFFFGRNSCIFLYIWGTYMREEIFVWKSECCHSQLPRAAVVFWLCAGYTMSHVIPLKCTIYNYILW